VQNKSREGQHFCLMVCGYNTECHFWRELTFNVYLSEVWRRWLFVFVHNPRRHIRQRKLPRRTFAIAFIYSLFWPWPTAHNQSLFGTSSESCSALKIHVFDLPLGPRRTIRHCVNFSACLNNRELKKSVSAFSTFVCQFCTNGFLLMTPTAKRCTKLFW